MRKALLLSLVVGLFLVPVLAANEVTIDYLGHSCFTITDSDGTIVMIDPYGTYVPYPALPKEADVVLITHGHIDHCPYCYGENDRVLGDPEIVWPFDEEGRVVEGEWKSESIEGLTVDFVEATHVTRKGGGQGLVCLFSFEVDDVRFAHFADLGRPLNEEQIEALGDVEVLFIPVGGGPTIDAAEAVEVIKQLPTVKVAIPMHYFVKGLCPWEDMKPIDGFIRLAKAESEWTVRELDTSQATVSTDTLPETLEVWALEYES